MTQTCKRDWRCRRICKADRLHHRLRPPRCTRQAFGFNTQRNARLREAAAEKREDPVSAPEAAMRLAAE